MASSSASSSSSFHHSPPNRTAARNPLSSTFTNNNTNPSSGIPYGHVPSYLAGSASLVEQLDQSLLVVLRDGRHLVGTLRSFDQFSNMILEDTCERRTLLSDGVCYSTSVPLGLYVVRGDSMVLLGQVLQEQNDDDDDATTRNSSSATAVHMKHVSLEEWHVLQTKVQQQQEQESPLEWDFDADLVA